MYIKDKIIMIMWGVHKHDTFREMAVAADVSIATIHERLKELIDDELVSPPPQPGLARAYSLTARGYEELEQNMPNLIRSEEDDDNVQNWNESYISVTPEG